MLVCAKQVTINSGVLSSDNVHLTRKGLFIQRCWQFHCYVLIQWAYQVQCHDTRLHLMCQQLTNQQTYPDKALQAIIGNLELLQQIMARKQCKSHCLQRRPFGQVSNTKDVKVIPMVYLQQIIMLASRDMQLLANEGTMAQQNHTTATLAA